MARLGGGREPDEAEWAGVVARVGGVGLVYGGARTGKHSSAG